MENKYNMNPQLSRKEEIEKGCPKCKGYYSCRECGFGLYTQEVCLNCLIVGKRVLEKIILCPTCQARLDERIRAEQDFLKMIDERIILDRGIFGDIWIDANALKSTIQKEKKE
jgi:hypothetical protein